MDLRNSHANQTAERCGALPTALGESLTNVISLCDFGRGLLQSGIGGCSVGQLLEDSLLVSDGDALDVETVVACLR